MSQKPPQALLFDFDGLMVDTEFAIYEAWRDLYLSQGHDLPLATYVQCVGSTFHAYDPMLALESLLGYVPDWPTLLAEKDKRIIQGQVGIGTMPGVRELLIQARQEGIRTAVASSSTTNHVLGWLHRLDLIPYFDAICTRDEVENAKPAPDLFLLAMQQLDTAPEHSLVLEDSANGLKAALAANVACVIVPNRITSYSDFTGAAAVLPTLHEATPQGLLAHARALS